MEEKKGGACSAYKGEKYVEGFSVNSAGTRLLRRHRHRWEYNIKINLVEKDGKTWTESI
jgi:hypothetical protein